MTTPFAQPGFPFLLQSNAIFPLTPSISFPSYVRYRIIQIQISAFAIAAGANRSPSITIHYGSTLYQFSLKTTMTIAPGTTGILYLSPHYPMPPFNPTTGFWYQTLPDFVQEGVGTVQMGFGGGQAGDDLSLTIIGERWIHF